jgi:hypothetical protein
MKSEIIKLIWDVESFHGLVLCAKIPENDDPDAAINCKFEDFEWLRRALESKPFTSFCDLPPVLRDKARIQIWMQGKRSGNNEKFTNPQKALERFEALLEKYGGSWDNILVVWSDPENQPQMQEEKDLLRSKSNELRSGL